MTGGKARKKPMSVREAELRAVYDSENIQLATHEFHLAGEWHEYKYDSEHRNELSEFQRQRGGRPREDKLAAKVCDLKDKGKTFKEIKELLEQTTHDHRSEDAYRKLAGSRKRKVRR